MATPPEATPHAAAEAQAHDDALSLDDLDRVVGGSDALPQNTEQHQYIETPPEGGYQPPEVHAPANLPDPIHQVEQHVTDHTVTGDQAVAEIAGIIGHQPDHSMQGAAGAEIASLVGRGIIDSNTAIVDLHNAVTQTHSLTGDQAVGVLAGMIAAQHITSGESTDIATAAHGEITALVSSGALDAHHAITAMAGIAGAQAGGFGLINEITTIATQHSLSPADVAADIGGTVDSHDLTGTEAVSLLTATASQMGGSDIFHAVGHEIADLVAHHGVSVDDAMAGINAMASSDESVVIPILAVAGAENHDLLAPAGSEIAAMLGRDPFFYSSAQSQFETQVTNGTLSLDDATAMLVSVAGGDADHGIHGQSGWASNIAVDLITQQHFGASDVMTDIQNAVTAGASGDAAVALLLGISTNGGYGVSLAPAADAALVHMLDQGQIDAAHAANSIAQTIGSNAYNTFYSNQAMQTLLAIGESSAPGAESAVTGALQTLLTSGAFDGAHLVGLMAGQVGANTAGGVDTAFDTAVLREVTDLVTTGAVGANTAITALADAGATTFRVFGRPEIAAEIETIAAASNLSAAQVIADVMAGDAVNSSAWGVMGMLSFLSGGGANYQAAAVTSLLSLVDGVHFGDGGSIVSGLGTLVLYEGLPVNTGVSLMAALVGDGTTAVHPDVAASEIASIISSGAIGAAQAMTDIHASVAGGVLAGDAALVLLANIAADATTTRVAVNTEMRALVSGSSPLIPPGHATDVLTALQAAANAAHNTDLATVITSELAVLASSDPATAVFQGLGTATSDSDLDAAATQLFDMIASGASTTAHVMADIDQAFANGSLTPLQASSLLVDIAAHGNGDLAVQIAAGAEFAKVLSVSTAAGTPILSGALATQNSGEFEVTTILGLGVGGHIGSLGSNMMTATLNAEGIVAFLAGGLGSNAISEATRNAFEFAARDLNSGNYPGVFFNMNAPPPPTLGGHITQAFNDIAAAHVMPGPELIRAVFVLTGVQYFNAGQELQTLIGNQSVSMTDVHTAITSGWWQADNAVQVLASMSSTAGALSEINGLLSAGTISVGRLISDLHDGLTGGVMFGQAVSAGHFADVIGMLAVSSDSNTLTLISNELAGDIIHGTLPTDNVAAVLTASGANHSAIVDQMLGHLGALNTLDAGHLLGRMVSGDITTLDHAITLLANQTGVLVNAVEGAVQQNDLGADQVMNAFTAAVGNGELSADQVKSIAVGMADTGDATMANTAGAMLAAAVSHGAMSAQDAMNELTSSANRYAHALQGSVGINVPSMTALLNSFVAHCNPADVGVACQEVMTLVNYNFFTPDSGAQVLIGFAENANAAAINHIGGFFSWEISHGQQSLFTIETLINQSIASDTLTGPHAMAIYAGLAEGSSGQTASDALGQITALMQGGHGTAQDAVAALAGVVGSIAATTNPSLVQLVGDQLNAIVTAHPEALTGIGDAITGGTLTGSQAASMLLGMTHSWNIPAGVVTEIDALVNANLMTPTQFMQALDNSLTSTALTPDAAVTLLANCWPGAGTAFEAQAAGMIVTMIQGGQLSAPQALQDINGTINHPLTVEQAVGLMTAICTPNNATISAAVAADLTQILSAGSALMSLDQVIAGIDHAVTSGAASADNAVTLLANLAPMSAEATAAAAQEIVSLIANNEIGAGSAVSYVTWAAGGTADHGVTFLIDIAANSTSACQLAFGSYIANLVGQGTITADQAVGFVRDAYAAQLNDPVHAPFTPGFVTAGQELKLLANILAGMASPGHLDATSLIGPVHSELLAAMHTPPYRATDTQVVAALQEAGLSGGPILAAANAEIARLEADPKVLIDVAAQTGLDMNVVGSQLATLISQGTLSVGEAMGDITAANTAHNLSNDQALTMIVSAVAHAASAGIYLQQQTTVSANNWLVTTASALEHLAQNGLSPDAIGVALHGVIGQGRGLLSPSDAVDVLASSAAYADLQGMAVTQVADLLTNPSFNLYPSQLASDVAGCVSATSGSGLLDAGAAVQLLAHVAATVDTPATYGGIALGLSDASSLAQIHPDTLANTITAMVQAHTLAPEQALHFLTPYGATAPGTVGHAIGSLIADNQVSMADFTALIFGGVQQTSDQIQNTNYWQQVAGTGNVTFDSAVVMLAAMTSQTDLAVTQLAQIAAADTGSVGNLIEARVLDAGMHPETSGLNPRDAVRAITILASDHGPAVTANPGLLNTLADDIGRLVGAATAPGIPAQYYMPHGDALAEVARLSVNNDAAVAQAGMAMLNVLVGQTSAYGNDGIVGAVGHGLTADQAVTILTDLSLTQTIAMQQHVRADIAYLIGHNEIAPAQAFADVHTECLAHGIGATQELSIYAGIIGAGTAGAAVESAVADAIVGLVTSGRLSLGQVMDGLLQGTVTSANVTQAQSTASYLAGGLSIANATSLMAVVAAHSTDPSAFGAVAAELAGMLGSYPAADRPAVMSGVDAAVASGLLSAVQAVDLLASTPLGASDDAKAAIGGEFMALISSGHISVDQAVAAIEGMAHDGTPMQQMQAGAAIGQLVAQNGLTSADAIGGVASALAGHALTPDQAVSVLAGMNAAGSTALSNAAGAEIMSLIASGAETGPHALSLLINAAENGTGTMLSGLAVAIDAMIAGHAVTAAQAMQSVETAWGSGALPTPAATALLVDMGGTPDASLQAAIGHEIGTIIQNCNAPNAAIATLGQQLAANVSQDQAVVMLASAIAGAGATTQTPLAALIATMINNGPIGIAQVLSDIDAAAASHALPATQALVALAHLEEAVPNADRTAVVNEATALVSNGLVPAADAAQTLVGAAHGGSSALQSLIGGILASLADHALLTNQQVVDAVMGTSATVNNSEALGVLMGMGVNGNSAAQAASGAGILSLIESGRTDVQTVTQLIDYESTHNGIMPEHGLQVLLNIMGAATGDLNAGATGVAGGYDKFIRDQVMAEVVNLVQTANFYGGGAHRTLLDLASHSIALAEAVGRCCADLGTNAAVISGSELAAAVNAGHMTADEGMMVAFASSLSGQAQGQWTFINFVQTAGLSVDQAIHFLAVTAAHTGDTDPNHPYLAYTTPAATDAGMMNAAFADMVALVQGIPGVPPQTASATLIGDIVAAAGSHDLSGMQAASMLAVLAGKLGGSDAIAAADGVAALVSQHQIDNQTAMHAIGWATSAGLDAGLASMMFASMALNPDPAVQQIAIWAFNTDSASFAQAIHGITASPLFTHDQALTIITDLASGLAALQSTAAIASTINAVSAEIVSMVAWGQMTADHAVASLAGLAATSSFHLGALGTELNALIAAGAISFDQVAGDLRSSALDADQVITSLVGIATANSTLESQAIAQITSMINGGAIAATEAMADIGQAPALVALHLLTMCANFSGAIEDAAAAVLAQINDAGGGALNDFYGYAKAHLDPVHAFGWIVSVGAHGNDALRQWVDDQFHWDRSTNLSDIASCLATFAATCQPSALVQYYIGQELGKLADQTPNMTPADIAQTVITAIDAHLDGTATRSYLATTPGQTTAGLPKTLTADTAATVLLGLASTTHNADVQAAADHDLKSVSGHVDADFLTNIAQVLPPQQALAQFVSIVQHGWADTALVANEISDMVAHGTLTATQVLTAISSLDTDHQLALVTDILTDHQENSSAFVSQFATLTLLSWGVAPTSPEYATLHEAVAETVPEFIGLVRGTTTAAQAINDIKGVATAHNVSADLLLMATYQSAAQDQAMGAASLGGALSTIGHEIYTHLTDGTAAHTIAGMVAGGSLSEGAADVLVRELASTATIPPNEIMQQVAHGNMSVWYADAHYGGWNSNADALEFTVTQSVAMLHVDVHVAQDITAILDGTMTGAAAVNDILHAGGNSEYAKDFGLLALAHGVENTAASDALHDIEHVLADRVSSGTSEDGLVLMSARGWLPAQQAVDMLHEEISVATTGVEATPAALFESMALARLDLAASAQVDPNATSFQQLMHGHATSGAIQNIIEGADAAKILTGLGALQVIDTDSYKLGTGIALAQHVTQVMVAQLQAQEAAHPGSTGDASGGSNLMAGLPPAVQQIAHYAEMAGQYFTLGLSYAPQGLAVLESVIAPAHDIHALTSDPANIQKWVDLGVDVVGGGVPFGGIMNLMGAGLPSWAGGMNGAVMNEALGATGSAAFGLVSTGSMVAVAILSIPAVESGMHDGGVTLGLMKSISAGCGLISGMVSGSIHTAANMYLATATQTFNAFRDVCTGQDASQDATQLGKSLFVFATGMQYDAVAQVGDDVGNAMVDLFSGNPAHLQDDAAALGMDTLKMLASNPFMSMAAGKINQYVDQIESLISTRDAVVGGFILSAAF